MRWLGSVDADLRGKGLSGGEEVKDRVIWRRLTSQVGKDQGKE